MRSKRKERKEQKQAQNKFYTEKATTTSPEIYATRPTHQLNNMEEEDSNKKAGRPSANR